MSTPQWNADDVALVRSVEPGFTDDEIVTLLDGYRRKSKNPVAYALNGKTKGRLRRDLEHVRGGTDAVVSDPALHAAGGEMPGVSRRLVVTAASGIRPRPVLWGWESRFPAGHMSLVPGREGIGKSLFLIDLCAKVTRGTLPGCFQGTPRAVFYCATEDSWQHTIIPRLIAAGADLKRVYRIDVETVEATGATVTLELSMPRDCDLLAAEIKRLEVAMVALDPLMSVISHSIDTHNDRELRTALEPVGRLADDTGAMVIGLAHFNKSADGDPLNLVTGSRAFTAYVRSVVAIARDPDSDAGQCIISQVKNNLGRMDLPNLTYVIRSVTVKTDEGDCDTGRIFLTGESEKSVRDILADTATAADRTDRAECADWLREKLTAGPQRTKDIENEAKANGYSERTLNRVRKDLQVNAYQVTQEGKRNEWWLKLPTADADRLAP